ncbi:DUF7281 domain-containing protein [Shewanella benthica]|uniref:DUF7281 domain-containing protein n=1 Tax=Shewanella benthica KT99 TaxID=314608 RepID=A9CUW9_9GAMM|nr:hypothetical protein [Shewanella benthica]EDQ02667.1 hypothetical protein KT99_05862 [Shewanella benthica KT99]
MQKGLFNDSKKMLRKYSAGDKIPSKAYLKRLKADYDFGAFSAGYFTYALADKIRLINKVKQQLGVHLEFDPYPEQQSRNENSKTNRAEKLNSYPVSRDFILINSINGLKINKQLIATSPLSSLGLSVKADEIDTVEHPYIVLVENLTLMANLASLILPDPLKDALWLYRGDVKPSQQTGMAYQFFRRWKDNPCYKLVCFSDLDPKGIEIAYTCEADYWLSPADCEAAMAIDLQGIEQEWHKQTASRLYLHRQQLPAQCQLAFSLMNEQHITLKQEHMLSHNLKLQLFSLKKKGSVNGGYADQS